MESQIVVGIDVAGKKKGFALAAFDVGKNEWLELRHIHSAEDVLECVKQFGNVRCIAIDCPPRALIVGDKTRLAERELRKLGFNVQWTRRQSSGLKPQEWMENGQLLWEVLEDYGDRRIETFPTAACEEAENCEMSIPLCKFALKSTRDHYKDLIDAALCAWVATKKLAGTAKVAGVGDELGPIYY